MLCWGFVGFLLVVIVSLFLVIFFCDVVFEFIWLIGVVFVVVGIGMGIFVGFIGVGGGVIVVLVLMLVFGMSDLVVKGIFLLMMILMVIFGMVGNVCNCNVDLFVVLFIGVFVCMMMVFGVWLVMIVDLMFGNMLFVVYFVVIVV